MQCDVRNHTRGKTPRIDFCSIAKRALGDSYELSVALVGDARARALNKKHRGKEYVPNVLSFSLSAHSGEIVINPKKAAREARRYNHTTTKHITFLFIHGCLHLRGLDHGSRMEAEEERLLKACFK